MIDPGYRSNSATEFPELYLPGIDPELDGIPGIRRNFQWFPGIPKSQVTGAYLGMIHPGYRLNSVTEFPELHRDGISSCNSGIPRNSYQFPPIPSRCNSRNSVAELLSAFNLTINYVYGYRLTFKINERFRYGIPGITSRRNQFLQFRNF
jgi:hypothetical protein